MSGFGNAGKVCGGIVIFSVTEFSCLAILGRAQLNFHIFPLLLDCLLGLVPGVP